MYLKHMYVLGFFVSFLRPFDHTGLDLHFPHLLIQKDPQDGFHIVLKIQLKMKLKLSNDYM